MSDSIKEQLSQDFQKAKQVGGVKVDRIRQIFQEALTQTLSELREGSNEIRTIAQESKTNWTGTRNSETSAPMQVPTEIPIDADHPVNATVDPEIEAQVDTLIEALVEANADTVVVETPTSIQAVPVTPETEAAHTDAAQNIADSIKSLLDRVMSSMQQGEAYGSAQKQLEKMKEQLLLLDDRLMDRYGDRYVALKREFRQDMEKAKTWYDETKGKSAGTGTTWAESKQSEVEAKMNDAGMTIAQKEQKIKQLLRELWQTATSKS